MPVAVLRGARGGYSPPIGQVRPPINVELLKIIWVPLIFTIKTHEHMKK
jgi:hypothetical protein